MSFKLGVVGATGLVGGKILEVLEERNITPQELYLLTTKKSAGLPLYFKGTKIFTREIDVELFSKLDYILFAVGGDVSEEFAPKAVQAGATVIDNSSRFRMAPHVPLVVPEVNPETAKEHQGIIANPNCSTIQLVVPLKYIDDEFGVKRVIVSTYQAVSGSGKAAMKELRKNAALQLAGYYEDTERKAYPKNIEFNCLPHVDDFTESGLTKEELKMINETRKIISPNIKISPTCVRVPVVNGHSEAVTIETEENNINPEKVREVLKTGAGIVVNDNLGENDYPTAIDCDDSDQIYVGRIRKDPTLTNGINLWIVADNLRKGAATNAVQILEYLLQT
ncbi:aspartate-semialdehyde dehydrogenase [Natranaerobius thermophilus]|uniref:Aspartate-semialdehyde dehydrogenase n=1 Tax=Natranaerobius thermophilus (strain ATCC BAA-1301 / DSM 18059 / JW/NM-WN-LF) TaxID=457570 RepID=B2A251_NATTJ|nr:aspartate-semialdehyde dehydrogenase [Natranaerobius thermophilus]ACB84856.1 aspartate semialdehyde dehydrogenase [Natranaerobius thermophilus JW/NM-WN-LF]